MCWWDKMWVRLLQKLLVKVLLYYRYVDDCRTYMKPFKAGWRCTDRGLEWAPQWEEEDSMSGKSPTQRTTDILIQLMNKILTNLVFTGEHTR